MAPKNKKFLDLSLLVSRHNTTYRIFAYSECLGKKAEAALRSSEVKKKLEPLAKEMQTSPLALGKNEELGRHLFEALIRDDVEDLYRILEGQSIAGPSLQLALNLQPVDLQWLPWECMFDPFWGKFLSQQKNIQIVRLIDSKPESEPKKGDQIYTSLVIAIANAGKLQPIYSQDTEKEYIDKTLGDLERAKKITYRSIPGSQSEIYKALSSSQVPDVFHFIGHGGLVNQIPGLYLEDEYGDAVFEDASSLVNKYFTPSSEVDRHIRVVILSACETAKTPNTEGYTSLAHQLASQVDAVLAMQFPIGLDYMQEFNTALYHDLANGESLEAAVNAARRKIAHDKLGITREWISPVLVLRQDKPIDQIRLAQKPNPFKGPLYYDTTDKQWFLGRDYELQKLRALYRDKRIIVINGKSGSGKTSLLKAGWMSELTNDNPPPIYISLGEDLGTQLHTKINRLLVMDKRMPLPEGDITTLTAQFPQDLTIVLDRVEQIEYLGEQITQILSALIKWISDPSQLGYSSRLVIATRLSEQGKEPALLLQQIPERKCRLHLDMLNYDQAYQWIESVTQQSGVIFPRETIIAILNGLNYQDPEKQSMMALQVVCSALFERAQELHREEATPELLTDKELADIDGILERVYTNKLDNNKYKQGDTAKRVLAQFIGTDNRMRPRSWEDLRLRCGLDDNDLKEIIDHLQEDSLLRPRQQKVEEKFELAHETLVTTLIKILSKDEDWPPGTEGSLRQLEEIVESTQTLIPLKSEKGGLEKLDDRREELTLSDEQHMLVLRSALEAEHAMDYWFQRVYKQNPELALSALTNPYLSLNAQERACHYLGLIGSKEAEFGAKAKETLLKWACSSTSPPGITRAASLALAPLADETFINQHFATRNQALERDEINALAIMHDAHPLPMKGLASSTQWQIRLKILKDNALTILTSVLRATSLGAGSLGLAVAWIYAQVYIGSQARNLPAIPMLLLELLLVGLLAFIIALPGSLFAPLGRDISTLLSGGRRNLPAALGTIAGSALGTGLTVAFLAVLAEYRHPSLLRLLRYFLSGAVLGAAIGLPWLLTIRFALKPLWLVLLAGLVSALAFAGVSTLDNWWPATSFALSIAGPHVLATRPVAGALIGLGSALGLAWGRLRNRPQ